MINWKFVRQVGFIPWVLRYSRRQFHKRVLRRDSRLRLPTGNPIILPAQSASATEVFVTNANIDWGAEEIFATFAGSQRDFLDIGSHIGYYAAYLSPLVRRVYAFEPDQRNLPALRANAALSGNVDIVEAAVSSTDGTANFHSGEGSAVGSLEDVGGATAEVRVMTIDAFAATRPSLDVCLVKIDTEGHDLAVLCGMQLTVARHSPLILTECTFSKELRALCDQWHYSVFAMARGETSAKASLREILPDDRDLWLKMIFLVPPRLRAAFEQLTACRT